MSKESAVGVALNVDVQHMDEAVNFLFLGPCDVRVKGVDVCEKSICVVVVDGYECVVGFTKPEEN